MTTLKFSLKQPKKVKAVKTPDFGEELSSTVIHEEPDEVSCSAFFARTYTDANAGEQEGDGARGR